jgi:hypothetical protein
VHYHSSSRALTVCCNLSEVFRDFSVSHERSEFDRSSVVKRDKADLQSPWGLVQGGRGSISRLSTAQASA